MFQSYIQSFLAAAPVSSLYDGFGRAVAVDYGGGEGPVLTDSESRRRTQEKHQRRGR